MPTTETRSVGTKVLDESGKPGSDPQEPVTTLAEKVQAAIDQGASLDELRRHFHLSESELRDYCSDIMDDEGEEDWPGSASGY